MSLSVGFPGAGAILINGKSPATIDALSAATAEEASTALGTDKSDPLKVDFSGQAEKTGSEEEVKSNESIVVQVLRKRMKELQEQLKQEQQELAAAQAARYPSPEAKQTVVQSIQARIANTSGALGQVVGNLVRELAKESSSGGLVNTTA